MKYRTIVADPPWHYADRPTSWGREKSRRSFLPYPTMTVEEICALPVSGHAAQDARLFLWTTNRYLQAAFDVIEAWDFTYQQTLVWCKKPMGVGPGAVCAQTTEYVFVCRRGKPSLLRGEATTWFEWPRSSQHSRKPEAFLDLVEQMSPGPYLELFARRQRLGWDTWGNEALEHVQL